MANNLIANTRQKAQNDFASFGNLKKFGSDLLTGAGPGMVAGSAFGLGAAGVGAISSRLAAAPLTQTMPGGAQLMGRAAIQGAPGQMVNGALQMNNTGQLGNALRGSAALGQTATGMAPFAGRDIASMIPNAMQAANAPLGFGQQVGQQISGYQALNEFLAKLTPEQQAESGVSQAIQQTPQASSGPGMFGQGGTGNQKPYYAFEKYFQGNNGMRPMINETAPGVTGHSPDQPKVDGNIPQETMGAQEDIFRPKSGISQKLYDFTKYVEESPLIQGASGLIANGAAAWFSGGTSTAFAPAIGAAASGLTKGIAGQLRQWLSVKEQQEQQQAQQGGVAQSLMQGA